VVIVQSILPISATRAPLCKTIMRQRSDLYFRITLFESANSITSCNKYAVKIGHWTRSSNPSWNPVFTSMPRFRKRPGCFNLLSRLAIPVYLFPCVETITRIFLWRISEIHRFEARSSAKGNIADPVSEMFQTTEFTCASLSQPGTPSVSSNSAKPRRIRFTALRIAAARAAVIAEPRALTPALSPCA